MKHELPKLPYKYTDLEPYIDAKTMEIHYSKHHQGYVTKLNAALAGHEDLQGTEISALLSDLEGIPEEIRTAVINNGGGHYNHSLFWNSMSATPAQPSDVLLEKMSASFESFDAFKGTFEKAALTRFGSGWAWLVVDGEKLKIISTANQDTPLALGIRPLLGLDVWEHAYYLNYQNKRGDYIKAWWNVVDWSVVEQRLTS